MQRIIPILLLALAAAQAPAGYEFVPLPADGSPVEVAAGGRAVALVGFDAFTAQRVDRAWTNAATVATAYATNFTYSLSYTNATVSAGVTNRVVVTNTTATAMDPLPAGLQYIAYWTNTVVTATSTTNWAPRLAACATNSIGAASLSGTRSFGACTNAWVQPGSLLRRSSAGRTGAAVVIER